MTWFVVVLTAVFVVGSYALNRHMHSSTPRWLRSLMLVVSGFVVVACLACPAELNPALRMVLDFDTSMVLVLYVIWATVGGWLIWLIVRRLRPEVAS